MGKFPLEPMEPKFGADLSPDQCAAMMKAHRWGYRAILAAIEHLRESGRRDYERAFDRTAPDKRGPDWHERRAKVERTFQRMAELLSTKSIVYRVQDERHCTGGMLANTLLGSGGPVNLCKDLFNDHWLRWTYWARADWVRALSVVHEISHAVKDGTEDIDNLYTESQCYRLAANDPARAVRNAQNYALCAMEGLRWAPEAESPDMGIWTAQPVGGAGPKADHAPAAAMIAEDVLMLAYREPWPRESNGTDPGGPLFYKTLDLHATPPTWSDATPIKAPGEVRSVAGPALAMSDDCTLYCAWVDQSGSNVMLSETRTNRVSTGKPGLPGYSPTGWDHLHWSPAQRVDGNAEPDRAPALAVFYGGESSGLYLVYVDKQYGLHCIVKFFGEGFFRLDKLPSGFTKVPFDKPRKASGTPALVIHQGQLKCIYPDEQGHWVTLNHLAAPIARPGRTDVRPGSWHEDTGSPFVLDVSTVALAPWRTPGGAALMAVGRGKGDDRTMHYACSSPTGNGAGIDWHVEVSTHACRTSYGSALVAWRDALHLFHQRDFGTLEWLTTKQPAS